MDITVLDTSALIAFLRDEAARDDVEELLRSEGKCCISAISVAETVDMLSRLGGVKPDTVSKSIGLLTAGGLTVAYPDPSVAFLAGSLRSTYYTNTCAISLAESFALATAKFIRAPLATADPTLASLARAENVDLVSLPNSSGKRPSA